MDNASTVHLRPIESSPLLAEYRVQSGVVMQRLLLNLLVLALILGVLALTLWQWWLCCAGVVLAGLVGIGSRLIALVHDLRFMTTPPTVTLYRDGLTFGKRSYRWEVVDGMVRPFYTSVLTPLRGAVYLVAAGDMVLLISRAFENHEELKAAIMQQVGAHFYPRHTEHLQQGGRINLDNLILSQHALEMGGATFPRDGISEVQVSDTRLAVKGQRVKANIRINDAQTYRIACYIRDEWTKHTRW